MARKKKPSSSSIRIPASYLKSEGPWPHVEDTLPPEKEQPRPGIDYARLRRWAAEPGLKRITKALNETGKLPPDLSDNDYLSLIEGMKQFLELSQQAFEDRGLPVDRNFFKSRLRKAAIAFFRPKDRRVKVSPLQVFDAYAMESAMVKRVIEKVKNKRPQKDVAREEGLSLKEVEMIWANRRSPSITVMNRVADKVGLSVERASKLFTKGRKTAKTLKLLGLWPPPKA